MPGALAEVLRRAPLTPEKVAFAWRTAVGAAVDRATGVELRGSTLVVAVKSDEWRHEIGRSLGLIRAYDIAQVLTGINGNLRIGKRRAANQAALPDSFVL